MKYKRFLCLGLVVALVCAGMPSMAVPAQEMQAHWESTEGIGVVEEDYAYKELEDRTLEITGYSGSSTALVVPSEIGGKRVTRIGDSAFVGCRDLESVSILEGVTQIGQHAFYGCSSLTSVSIPGSVAAMGRDAFLFCSSLTDIRVAEESEHYTSE